MTLKKEAGRLAVSAGPVFVLALLSTSLAAALSLAVLWFVSFQVGRSLGAGGLSALRAELGGARGAAIALVATTTLSSWAPWLDLSTGATALAALVTFVLVVAWEGFALRHVLPPRRVLIVGSGAPVAGLTREIRLGPWLGYDVIGVVHDGRERNQYAGVPVLGRVADLGAAVLAERPDLVVLAPGPNRPETFEQLLQVAEAGFRVVELAQFYEHAYGRVPVRDLSRAWFMSVLHLYQRPYSRFAKRSFDLLGSSLLLAVTLPLFPVVALLVRQTPGPIFLRQLRLGEHGRLYTIYKFRTMVADAERLGTAVWAQGDDPRITPAGGIVRRLRLDELPQLWNVVKGDMSLVGPRPERPEFLDELSETVPFWTRRLLVKPGLTGWAQVRQGYAASTDATAEKLSYDLWYIRHRSLTVDIAICVRTVAVIMGGDGRTSLSARVDTLIRGSERQAPELTSA